jgi:hypothetical protein
MPTAFVLGKPDAGNPPVRFDEGRGGYSSPPTLPIIEHLQSNLPSAPNKFSRVILANALGAGPLYGQRWFACAARGCW